MSRARETANAAANSTVNAVVNSAPHTVTAFRGSVRLAQGALVDVARVAFDAVRDDIASRKPSLEHAVLIFDDRTGRVIDLEMRGGERAMLASLKARGLLSTAASDAVAEAADVQGDTTAPRGRGRPKLGVVPREVTLLPRHWEWLATQPGGASVALRKLIDAARKTQAESDHQRVRREAAYAAMAALAGDRPHFEDASRALFRGDHAALSTAMRRWPADITAYVQHLLSHQP
ncbi:MAG: DUF2239 family protein [Gemmatimonadaceae bacterium]|nr:DUF2239 family protein [Gemmatimonadaceae bacterium]